MSDTKEKDEEKPVVAKTAVDLQRLKLVKLMKNMDKPIVLPERPKAKSTPSVPEFVRNVMGSSAGAGSGEFHVYRHLRRKEYARQKFIQEKAHKEFLDAEYHEKLAQNKRVAEEATAKKRAKRLKKKQGRKQRSHIKNKEDNVIMDEKQSEDDSSNDEEIKTKETEETNEKLTIENTENTQNCSKNTSTDENETNAMSENEENISKVPLETLCANNEQESDT